MLPDLGPPEWWGKPGDRRWEAWLETARRLNICHICKGRGTLPDLPVTVTCICKLPTLTHHKGLG